MRVGKKTKKGIEVQRVAVCMEREGKCGAGRKKEN